MNKELLNNNEIETGLNQKFFKQVIENSHLSEESKKRLGDLDKGWKNDQVKEILKEEDKSKIQTYEELNVQELPKDWRAQLIRLKHLEKLLADYEPKIEELKTWTDTFGEQKPEEVQEKFTNLEKEYSDFKQKSEEQIQELTKKCELAENKAKEWELTFPNQTAPTVWQEKEELKKNLGEWIENWGKELEEVKAEWEELQKRPNIAITEEQFWDDYVRREKIEQSKLKDEELAKEREKVKKLTEKNRKLFFAVNSYLKAIRTKKYTLMKPVKTIKQAREAIAELLEETERGWSYYLEGNDENIVKTTLELGLSTWEREKEQQVRQILEWIKEARVTLDYEKLLERWNSIIKKDEGEENDFDGTPYLLEKLLEVKDFEAPPTINEKEEEAL